MLKLFEVLWEVEKVKKSGKTNALAQAADDTKGVLLVTTYNQAQTLQPLYPNAIITTPHNLEKIKEYAKPMFIDHHLLFILAKNFDREKREKLDQFAKTIEDLKLAKSFDREKIDELEKQIEDLKIKLQDVEKPSKSIYDENTVEQINQVCTMIDYEKTSKPKEKQSLLSRFLGLKSVSQKTYLIDSSDIKQ